jgi:hypothetical protein
MKYKKRKNWKYRLWEDETYESGIVIPDAIRTEYIRMSASGLMTVKRGYCWDGASGPTWDTKNTFVASLFHDALYQLIREGWLDLSHRKEADKVLYRLLRASGMSMLRARVWYRGVRTGAAQSARYNVLTAY